jgi:hypothetical protein
LPTPPADVHFQGRFRRITGRDQGRGADRGGPWHDDCIRGIACRWLEIEDLVKRGHFDPRIAESRRELLHGGFLPVGEERTPGTRVLMPFQ